VLGGVELEVSELEPDPEPFCFFSFSSLVVVCFLVVLELVDEGAALVSDDDPVLPLIPVEELPVSLEPVPDLVSEPMLEPVPEDDPDPIVPDLVSLLVPLDVLLPVCPCAWVATNSMPAAARPSPQPKYLMIPPLF
jgi:hypothetical protein